ncbi:MAG TPA: NADH-quinone oxidoreductase subunit L [Planctomycetaceae bacterium]|jgi:NADH-quinone oxidoreductase subunit L|nr:NADH-quinone oxidoreductase subunit L [Planctomycetaceae bacterium]
MNPELYESTGSTLKLLLSFAWLAPLAGFAIEIFAGYWSTRRSKAAAYLAVLCIFLGFCASVAAFGVWGSRTGWAALTQHEEHGAAPAHQPPGPGEAAATEHAEAEGEHAPGEHATTLPSRTYFSGSFYTLARFGSLIVSLDYYIDSLTLVMFMMVTLIATCIHVFAIGYMSDELTDDYVDHQVHTGDGGHLHRPGRYYRFFSYMSLFCFSMLGLVLAGNIFQVFIFWELVGICSYFLIGFYVERRSASTAANKAFIMNRVGDFGFLIGLMVLWTWFGTFQFSTHVVDSVERPGLFEMLRGPKGELDVDTQENVVRLHDPTGQHKSIPYLLLVVAGLGVFGGCVGKSAQFPLQTWLPDAMEGPTPVSALVHSATMVAAGVYLAGRFFPMFTPEVLLTIAYVGCVTLFLAATIAVVATDIKRVLAYSTISQLGYMMLGIGVGGWGAGLFHLITHAFFKSLMFLASGSVIVGCHHEQDMTRMGGLLRKMPITAITMLVGVIAISGLAIPVLGVAFSGYHSKDAIVASALAFRQSNPVHFLLFFVPLLTAGITAFYMFRLWFFTFAGQPRDAHVHDHAKESPWVMTGPLMLLSVFAIFVAFGGESGPLYRLLIHSEPAGLAAGVAGSPSGIVLPAHEAIHAVHADAGDLALIAAFSGLIIAYLLYGLRVVNPADIARQLRGLHSFLVEKWQFDHLYEVMFVRPVLVVSRWFATFDRVVIDGFLHALTYATIDVSKLDRRFDESVIDGMVNAMGDAIFAVGRSFRVIQTGSLRQYVMFIAIGVVALFMLLMMFFPQ